jgi:hypothetical protein
VNSGLPHFSPKSGVLEYWSGGEKEDFYTSSSTPPLQTLRKKGIVKK